MIQIDIQPADYTQNSRQNDQNPAGVTYPVPIIKSENRYVDWFNFLNVIVSLPYAYIAGMLIKYVHKYER